MKGEAQSKEAQRARPSSPPHPHLTYTHPPSLSFTSPPPPPLPYPLRQKRNVARLAPQPSAQMQRSEIETCMCTQHYEHEDDES